MINPSHQRLRIVLLCDNVARELDYLRLLKQQLEKTLNAQVHIVGSVAEMQRTYLWLNQIRPHAVLLTQVVEDSMRELAKRIHASGSLVFVLPPEVLVNPSLSLILANPKIKYDHLVDGIFLPGKRMRELFRGGDIQSKKLKVVGTPKIDVLILEKGRSFFSRSEFMSRIGAKARRKNIVIFTSFVQIPITYMSKNESFRDIDKELTANNHFVEEARTKFITAIKKLCLDFPCYNIILKPHPLEKKLGAYSNNYPNFFLAENMSFYNCLHSIDLAIHWTSTIATECWLKNIKTIQYLPHAKFKNRIVESWPGNPIVSSYPQLKAAVNKYLNNDLEKKYIAFQRKYLTDNFYKLDGLSCKRISIEIKQIMATADLRLTYPIQMEKSALMIVVLERLIGVQLSRFVFKLMKPDYKWRYAITNFVNII